MANLVCPITDVAPLLPHSNKMMLIDKITAFGADFLVAESVVSPDHILIKNSKLDTFAGIEIMAQGVAAWAGCLAFEADKPVRLGYLLGSRKLHLHSQHIEIGTRLQIQIKMSIQDTTGFGVFDCQLVDLTSGKVIIEGALNVFSPTQEEE